MSFQQEVKQQLEKIADQQIKHTIALTENTVVLKEHHVRASNLEARFQPIEKHVLAVHSFVKITLAMLTAGATMGAIYHYFVK